MIRIATLILIELLITLGLQARNYPKREMRAIWIATVANIDWPSRAGLSVDMQQEEMVELLNLAKEYHLNTVIFQVRPATDAFFPSGLEPWSQWLTGEQGKAPDPLYDPLQFAIAECRKRGLELHLWLNPYRAVVDTAKSSIAENHPIHQHPEWFVTYGKARYFNPGLPQTRNHVATVVADLLRRYDVDALHFDDYFYPYRIAGQEFPDQEAFEKYPRGFTPDQKEDWRRDNVDLIIKQLHDTIEAVRPTVAFGISPFGVWRNQSDDPRGSATKAGQTNYDDLYANILRWQEEGWIDYVTPQIYWHIGKEVADYAIIADWWSKNALGCRLYTGQAFYRINRDAKDREWRSSRQIIKQLRLNRFYPNIDGSMFFSAKSLRSNPLKLKEKLLRGPYRYHALPPVNPRVEQITPGVPLKATMEITGDSIHLSWMPGRNNQAFVIYKFRKGKPANAENPENIFTVTGENDIAIEISRDTNPGKYYFVVSALSPTNQESVLEYFFGGQTGDRR
ncbi:glycoside hydrolase family 10 protein [Thermophagus sp. OGC60D27]|uniref:glycoside hydrolase family 10 protein n=1 Tax=Thermophagus sp. OGC60D27 TaxID=3458415 RepID=UPI0040382D25